jgi:hypothetical protein
MKYDSWASLLARTFASLCLGHKPKAKVVTIMVDIRFVHYWKKHLTHMLLYVVMFFMNSMEMGCLIIVVSSHVNKPTTHKLS